MLNLKSRRAAAAQAPAPTHHLGRETVAPVPGRWDPGKGDGGAQALNEAAALQRGLEDQLLTAYEEIRAQRSRVAVLAAQLIAAGIEPRARE